MNPDSTDAKSTEEVPTQAQRFIVGLGASAGGLDSLEKFFKKMLKQGGEFKVKGNKFRVTVAERIDIDSAGNKPVTVPPLPGERTF